MTSEMTCICINNAEMLIMLGHLGLGPLNKIVVSHPSILKVLMWRAGIYINLT